MSVPGVQCTHPELVYVAILGPADIAHPGWSGAPRVECGLCGRGLLFGDEARRWWALMGSSSSDRDEADQLIARARGVQA